MTNGKMVSGFCAPRLVWAEAPVAAKAASKAIFASFLLYLLFCTTPIGPFLTGHDSDGTGVRGFGAVKVVDVQNHSVKALRALEIR
jgi:hypothetical protein